MDIVNTDSWIQTMFVSLLYSAKLPQHQERNLYFYNKVKELKSANAQGTNWRCDTFSTINSYDLINDPVFVPVLNDIKQCVIEYSKNFGVTSEDLRCSTAWLNLAEPGQYQEYHIHSNSHFSVAYYIKTPDNCGNIVFRSHEASTDMYPLPVDTVFIPNAKTYSKPPAENELLVFRSNMYHMVEKNNSTEDRVSISANFYFKTRVDT